MSESLESDGDYLGHCERVYQASLAKGNTAYAEYVKSKIDHIRDVRYQKWFLELWRMVLDHPAMAEGNDCAVTYRIEDALIAERALYDSGMTVKAAYDMIDEKFNVYGW